MSTPSTIQERLASPEARELVKAWLAKNKGKGRGKGRRALALHICEALRLRDHRGGLRLAGVAKALRVLEARGHWRLPKPRSQGGRGWQPRRLGHAVAAPQRVPARAEQVRELHLVEVGAEDDELFRTWNELILSEHPLQKVRGVGRQLRYLIGSAHGWLGAIGFGSSALRLAARDQWIGWDESMRKAFQDRLINMTRFLICPCVRCENLASRVLSLVMERLPGDSQRRYGLEPWLVESFVDTEQYAGTCYQAANWSGLGQSAGRGRNGRRGHEVSAKELYLYELNRHWRQAMGLVAKSETLAPLGLEESLHSDAWVRAEFGDADLGHQDSVQRLLKIAEAKSRNPSATYSECFAGDRHELKAYYRFVNNKRQKIDPESILGGHRRQTIRRIKARQRVLVVQDTTDLDFSERLHCNDLGDIGKNQTGAISQGLKMHSALALSEEGLPLGVLRPTIYASHFDTDSKTQNRPIEEKESYRWLRTIDDLREVSEWAPHTELITVGDRESDLFELFDYRRRKAPHIHVLVRARYDRCLEDDSRKLFGHLQRLLAMGQARIQVPRQREKKGKPSRPGRIGLPARQATVELRWDKVTVSPPATAQTRHMAPLELYAVLVSEPNPPAGASPLHWVLLTTVQIDSRKQALRCLRWYTRRWRIEEWHRVLKSGCHVESHQHHSAATLARAIAIDTVIPWRVMLLALLGREVPNMPCQLIFTPWECALLERLQPLVAPETMQDQKTRALNIMTATIIIARLGGALKRSSCEQPGAQTLLRGFRRFNDIGLGFVLRDGKSAQTIAIGRFLGHVQA